MALALSLSSLQQTNCAELVLTDTAGTYNVTTNPDGWGTPNLVIDDGSVTYAELIITLPSASSITIDIIDNWEALTGLTNAAFGATTSPSALSYTITAALLGATSIADGIYTVTYQVGDGTTYANSTNKATVTYNYALYCNIECCIEQRLVLVPDNYECQDCSNSFLETTMILWSLLQALKLAACSASTDQFNNILATLQTACEDAGCDCA